MLAVRDVRDEASVPQLPWPEALPGFRVLADAESAIREVHPELEISVDLQTSAAVPSLLAQTDDALLLVMGSRGTGGFRGILVGSTAVALVASVAVIVTTGLLGSTDDDGAGPPPPPADNAS